MFESRNRFITDILDPNQPSHWNMERHRRASSPYSEAGLLSEPRGMRSHVSRDDFEYESDVLFMDALYGCLLGISEFDCLKRLPGSPDSGYPYSAQRTY